MTSIIELWKRNPWYAFFPEVVERAYFVELDKRIQEEYGQFTCYPPNRRIFAAFDYCTPAELKVVLIGQDPYHGAGQANGLCFSVADGVDCPPSLVNIFKEMQADLQLPIPDNGNLERWAKQGVLMLNAILSVRENQAGSHQKMGWERFTDEMIAEISARKTDIVFLLWGGYAKKKGAKIDTTRHLVLTSGHPSPLSANQGLWFGNGHFGKTNAYLNEKGIPPIQW